MGGRAGVRGGGVPPHVPAQAGRAAARACPPPSSRKLRRALRHYGVADLARSPELEESLYRICKAHQREEQLASPVSLLLERFLEGEAGVARRRARTCRPSSTG